MKKILKAAAITACVSVGAHQMYRCLSRCIAKSFSRVYSDAIANGAVVTVTLKMPSGHHHKED